MKKILALTSAIVSMFAVQASASYSKTAYDGWDEARFDNNISAYRTAIGVGAGQTLDTASALDAVSARATALLGDSTLQAVKDNFKLITRAFTAGTFEGWTADLVDASDAIAHRVGTMAAYNSLTDSIVNNQGGNAMFQGAGLFVAGVNGSANRYEILSVNDPVAAATAGTAVIPQAIVAGDVNDNTFAREDSCLRILYRRIARFEDGNTVDGVNVGNRRVALTAINNRQTGNNVLPTEDQFTLEMATEFFVRVQIQAMK
ncbi:MAG: hypothetical protein ACTHJ4_06140 [Candidatus Nucleicultricaceae bacterium]